MSRGRVRYGGYKGFSVILDGFNYRGFDLGAEAWIGGWKRE